METMLESEAMAILVGAGVSYGRREAALRAAGGALAILEEPGGVCRAASGAGRGARPPCVDGSGAHARRAGTQGDGACSAPGTNIIRRCFGTLRTRRTCSMVYGQTDLTDQFPVAVVGTRRASAYGLNHTRQMAAELANVGVCIVSGLALGIDAAAHTGALDAKGRTVAILGSALDQPYPAENRPLMRRILESGGSVVSEYPPGTVPTKYSFLQRNRIIAGMSLGTLVTEGPKRSGALNTAMRTIENGREVFALPGSVDSPGSQLPNMLIGDGARLVTCADDILAALVIEPKGAPRIPQASAVQPEMTQPVRNAAGQAEPETGRAHIPGGLDETRRAVCAALLAGEADFDALCAAGGMESDELGALLIEMEMDGLVTPLAGTRYAPGPQMRD